MGTGEMPLLVPVTRSVSASISCRTSSKSVNFLDLQCRNSAYSGRGGERWKQGVFGSARAGRGRETRMDVWGMWRRGWRTWKRLPGSQSAPGKEISTALGPQMVQLPSSFPPQGQRGNLSPASPSRPFQGWDHPGHLIPHPDTASLIPQPLSTIPEPSSTVPSLKARLFPTLPQLPGTTTAPGGLQRLRD